MYVNDIRVISRIRSILRYMCVYSVPHGNSNLEVAFVHCSSDNKTLLKEQNTKKSKLHFILFPRLYKRSRTHCIAFQSIVVIQMASYSTYLSLAILVVAGSLMYNTKEVSAQCGGSLTDLIAQCSQYVQKSGPQIKPSAACCAVLRKFNVQCACKLITKEVASLVSIPKAVFVARTCGFNLPPGMHCGGNTLLPCIAPLILFNYIYPFNSYII